MKVLALLLFSSFTTSVFAGYSCTDKTGNKVAVIDSFRSVGMTLQAKDLASYYKKKYDVDIDRLTTIVEESEGPIFTAHKDGFESLLQIEDSEIFNLLWNIRLTFIPNSGLKANVLVTDMEGVEFKYLLQCEQTPSLE